MFLLTANIQERASWEWRSNEIENTPGPNSYPHSAKLHFNLFDVEQALKRGGGFEASQVGPGKPVTEH